MMTVCYVHLGSKSHYVHVISVIVAIPEADLAGDSDLYSEAIPASVWIS